MTILVINPAAAVAHQIRELRVSIADAKARLPGLDPAETAALQEKIGFDGKYLVALTKEFINLKQSLAAN